jgi:signal peptide peptidase SppA
LSRYANIADLFSDHWMLHRSVLDKAVVILSRLGTPAYSENRAIYVEGQGERERVPSVSLPGQRFDPYQGSAASRNLGRLGAHLTEAGVAHVPIYGVLGKRMSSFDISERGTSTDMLTDAFETLAGMDSVRGVVLDIDSPGGNVLGVQQASDALNFLRGIKPVAGNINEIGASGAYFIGSHVDDLSIAPTGYAGSIGVYTTRVDMSRFYEGEGIDVHVISAGEFKADGHPTIPFTDGERTRIQSEVDTYMDMFKAAVARGRGISMSEVEKVADGSVSIGQAAVDRGLVDRVAYFKDVAAEMEAHVKPVYSLQPA